MQRTNEHYLPRFLMRGFASQVKGKESKTWWFRRSMHPNAIETNIKNIGAEKDFHSSFLYGSADKDIKPLEDRFGWYLDALRQQTNPAQLDDAIIPELIANLTVRTKAFRAGMTSTVISALREVITNLSDTEKLNKIVSVLLGDPSHPLAKQVKVKLSHEKAAAFMEKLVNDAAFLHSPLGSFLGKNRVGKL